MACRRLYRMEVICYNVLWSQQEGCDDNAIDKSCGDR